MTIIGDSSANSLAIDYSGRWASDCMECLCYMIATGCTTKWFMRKVSFFSAYGRALWCHGGILVSLCGNWLLLCMSKMGTLLALLCCDWLVSAIFDSIAESQGCPHRVVPWCPPAPFLFIKSGWGYIKFCSLCRNHLCSYQNLARIPLLLYTHGGVLASPSSLRIIIMHNSVSQKWLGSREKGSCIGDSQEQQHCFPFCKNASDTWKIKTYFQMSQFCMYTYFVFMQEIFLKSNSPNEQYLLKNNSTKC